MSSVTQKPSVGLIHNLRSCKREAEHHRLPMGRHFPLDPRRQSTATPPVLKAAAHLAPRCRLGPNKTFFPCLF